MNRAILLFIAGTILSTTPFARTFDLDLRDGEATVYRSVSGERESVEQTATLRFGDTLSLRPNTNAILSFEENSRVIFRGPGQFSIDGDISSLEVFLNNGELFLDRNQPHRGSVVVEARGYKFSPEGSAAAIRITPQGVPTTAVVRGNIRMLSGSGKSILVNAGNYGTVNAQGELYQAELSSGAIESIENWERSFQPQPQEPVEEEPADLSDLQVEVLLETEEVENDEPPQVSQQIQAESLTSAPSAAENQTSNISAEAVSQEEPSDPRQAEDEVVYETDPQDAATEDETEDVALTDPTGSDFPIMPSTDPATASSPQWELGAGLVSVGDEQWTRLALGVEVPIWKFGVFFDLEFFVDGEGKFSNKGWDFSDNWAEALSRKVRYVRFGMPNDPLYVRFGALSDVTLGYGFVVDRFTNMLRYPDERLPGLQVNINDFTNLGISVQTMVGDFLDFRNDGGVVAGRLAVTPFRMSETPVLNRVTVGATYALDRNMYAPARNWEQASGTSLVTHLDTMDLIDETLREILLKEGINPEVILEERDELRRAQGKVESFAIVGGDIGVPLIRNSLLSLDLYAQGATREDRRGWGIGAPGVAVRVWRLWGNLEYRRIQGEFTPGHFGQYYLSERLTRKPRIETKVDKLSSDTLNGVFGRLGMNIADVLVVDGSYQYMLGKHDNKDQKFEIKGTVGDMILSRIPKLNRAEVYYQKSRIGSDFNYDRKSGERLSGNDSFFGLTPYTYMGYRAGIEIAQGAGLIFDYRYGFKLDQENKLVSDNHVSILTAITF
ncbi:hypothetical protein CHISP_1029 [Chitinispirillum alkaliphilum]|nr:hypothetical protein CHISP_1029 [Chitinispirillum alkaliphilum]